MEGVDEGIKNLLTFDVGFICNAKCNAIAPILLWLLWLFDRYFNYFFVYRSISVVGTSGYRLFTLASVDKVEEIFCSNNESTKISERLFSSSLVAVVTTAEPHKLKVSQSNQCQFIK